MKRFIKYTTITIIVATLSASATAVAQRYIGLPWTNNIYWISERECAGADGCSNTVSVFDDGGNKCYITGGGSAISCVRMK